jgi:hypothetical protein
MKDVGGCTNVFCKIKIYDSLGKFGIKKRKITSFEQRASQTFAINYLPETGYREQRSRNTALRYFYILDSDVSLLFIVPSLFSEGAKSS